MAQKFNCVNPGCGREFQSTARFVESSNGLCPTCLKTMKAVPCECTHCKKKFLWFQQFAEVVGHDVRPQKFCPTCADLGARTGNLAQPIVADRQALAVFPLVRINLDLEGAVLCDPQGKARDGRRNPAYRMTVKDDHGKSYEGRLDIYDYRQPGRRGFGTTARVRVMEVTHAERPKVLELFGQQVVTGELTQEFDATYRYLVLEPASDDVAGRSRAALVIAGYEGKTAAKGGKSASGEVLGNEAFWSTTLTSASRTGAHWGGTVVAIVDDEHPLVIRQDNFRWRYGLNGRDLEEPGFRESGLARLSLFIPSASAELAERLDEAGFKTKLVGRSAFVRLKRMEEGEGFLIPENIGEYELRVESVESGGGFSSTGWSQVVCALDGTALRPFGTAGHRGQLCCGDHGWFSCQGGLVTVQACRRSADPPVTVELATHTVVQDGNTVRLVSETLYKGAPDALPFELEHFAQAVNAAAEKARDYHCRSLHYVQ